MVSSTSLISLGRSHMRPFRCWVLSLRIPPSQGRRMVLVTDKAVSALRPWRAIQSLTEGVRLGLVSSRLVIATDTSLRGWGGHLPGADGQRLMGGGPSCCTHQLLGIDCCAAGPLSLSLSWIRQQLVLVRTVNLTSKFYINKQGGLRSHRLVGLTRSFSLWGHEHIASLRAEYVPGLLNCGADLLSKGQP